MDRRELVAHLRAGEGISAEFKRCGNRPEKDFFETVCSFANRQGGNIFLGVEDDGTVSTGLDTYSTTDTSGCAGLLRSGALVFVDAGDIFPHPPRTLLPQFDYCLWTSFGTGSASSTFVLLNNRETGLGIH